MNKMTENKKNIGVNRWSVADEGDYEIQTSRKTGGYKFSKPRPFTELVLKVNIHRKDGVR
jgi:hypothetical protein